MAPIMKAHSASRIANGQNLITSLNSRINDDEINRKDLVEDDNIESYSSVKDFNMGEMYNIFSSNDKLDDRAEFIRKAMDNKGLDSMQLFETNLEIVNDSLHLAYIREGEYNKILPIIQANLSLLELTSYLTKKNDADNIRTFIIDHIKTTVFDESLINRENKQMFSILNHGKKLASTFILGGNFRSGIKETSVSLLTLYTRALATNLTGL